MENKLPEIPYIPEPYDSGWKRILFRYFFPTLAYFVPDLFMLFDTKVSPEFLDKDLKQIIPGNKIGHRNADVLVKVRLLSGQDQILYCHLELQTKVDKTIDQRAFTYAYRIYDKFGHFPLTILILADTDATFRPSSFNLQPTQFGGVRFRFVTIKTIDYLSKLDELRESQNLVGQVLWVYLEHQKMQKKIGQKRAKLEKARQWFELKVRIMDHLINLNLDGTDVSELLLFLDWMVHLPLAMEHTYVQLQTEGIRKKEGKMAWVSSYERVGRMLGRKEGREVGKEEGEVIGQINTYQKAILRILQKRATLTPEEQQQIASCQDLGILDRAFELCVDGISKEKVMAQFLDDQRGNTAQLGTGV